MSPHVRSGASLSSEHMVADLYTPRKLLPLNRAGAVLRLAGLRAGLVLLSLQCLASKFQQTQHNKHIHTRLGLSRSQLGLLC